LIEKFFHFSLSDLKHNHLMCYWGTEFSTEYIEVTIIIQLYDVFVFVVVVVDDDDKDKAHINLSEW